MARTDVAADMTNPATAPGSATRVEALLEGVLGIPVRLRFRFTHFVQMSVQFLLFVYWAAYAPITREYLTQLGYLVLFAFGVDFAVSALRYKSWYASFAPIPVVFSANLFVWFLGSDAPFSYAVVALAIASKHLIHRGGKHIFNPSAFGVCVIAIPCLLYPNRFGEIDLAHALNAPPNMQELVLFVGLVAMTRLPLALVSLSAFITSRLLSNISGESFYVPSVMWAPIFLGITLLVTDPATTPKKPLGQVIFGVTYMLLFSAIATALHARGLAEHWAKMLPIPVVNLLVPVFDRIADSTPKTQVGDLLEPRYNRFHVAAWVAAVLLSSSAATKGMFYDGELSLRTSVALTFADGEGNATCATNPVHCKPFSFLDEIAMWRRGWGAERRVSAPGSEGGRAAPHLRSER